MNKLACMLKSSLLLLLAFFFSFTSIAATSPAFAEEPRPALDLKNLNVKMVEKITGKKMTLGQKISFLMMKKKLKKLSDEESFTPKQKQQATMSLILGLASIGLLFIPYLGIVAIPAAILAVIFGAKSIKGNSNTKGIIGLVAGATTLILLIIAIIVITSSPWF